jgi:glyoxylase-like metal-dependent hydrolase (beta-lactamase superfamily II)
MGSLADGVGIFSRMTLAHAVDAVLGRLEISRTETAATFWESTKDALESGLPRMWIVCQFCGAHTWIFPPHGIGDPCPLIKDHYDSIGAKMTTEQNQAILSGQQMEAMAKAMRRQFGMEEGE